MSLIRHDRVLHPEAEKCKKEFDGCIIQCYPITHDHKIMSTTKRKRSAVRQSGCVPVTVWLPKEFLAAVDAAVIADDSDRSKLVRKALRVRLGLTA